MPLITRWVVFAAFGLPFGVVALAQSTPTPDTATLLRRIEEQDRRIEALEHKLEVLENQQAAVSAGAQADGGQNGVAQPGQTGVGQAGVAQSGQSVAGQAGAGQVAGQPGAPGTQRKPPPVPQTTGALPSSPSTAVQGA